MEKEKTRIRGLDINPIAGVKAGNGINERTRNITSLYIEHFRAGGSIVGVRKSFRDKILKEQRSGKEKEACELQTAISIPFLEYNSSHELYFNSKEFLMARPRSNNFPTILGEKGIPEMSG